MTDQETMSNVKGGAAVGATIGGILGALISFILSTTPQAIPVIGPTVGQGVIATVVVGLLAGVGLGALAGALFGSFSSTQSPTLSDDHTSMLLDDRVELDHEPDLASIEPANAVLIEEVAADDLLEVHPLEEIGSPALDITAPEQALEGPLEIEAEVAAAEVEDAAPDSADLVSPPENTVVPPHTSRTRRARRVAPKYGLPDPEKK